MTETTFKDVWLKNDEGVERDVIAAWSRLGVLPADSDPVKRAKELAVVGYKDGNAVAMSSVNIEYLREVRQMMAMFRIFIVPECRKEGIAIPLTHAVFDAMSTYSRNNPHLRIGGLAAFVVVKGHMDKPFTPARLNLIGYSATNHPIIVKWFEHFELDEEAALLRIPRWETPGAHGS
jgi:hypothetical protein